MTIDLKASFVWFIFLLLASRSEAQSKNVYTIPADSVKLTYCDSAELIIENHTQNVPGFLYNTGNGRTIFKRGLQNIGGGAYVIGRDTLKLNSNAWVPGGNAFGTTGVLGTLDSNNLDLYTNSKFQGRLTTTGKLMLGTTIDDQQSKLQVVYNNMAVDDATLASFRADNTSSTIGISRAIYGITSGLGSGFNGLASVALQSATTASGTWGVNFSTPFVLPCGNCGGYLVAAGTTTGGNVGVAGEGINGNNNVGVLGKSTQAKNSAANVGVMGHATNAGAGSVMIEGIFGNLIYNSAFSESAALIADNGTSTNPIFLGRKNCTKVFMIDSTGTSLTHLIGYSATPSILAGAGAGTSASVAISGTDLSGTISLTTGASPSAGSTIITVSFSSAFPSAPRKFLQATNAATIRLAGNSPIPSTTTTTLVLTSQTALAANTTYTWDYMLVQ